MIKFEVLVKHFAKENFFLMEGGTRHSDTIALSPPRHC